MRGGNVTGQAPEDRDKFLDRFRNRIRGASMNAPGADLGNNALVRRLFPAPNGLPCPILF